MQKRKRSLEERLYIDFYYRNKKQSPQKTERLSRIFSYASKATALAALAFGVEFVYDFLNDEYLFNLFRNRTKTETDLIKIIGDIPYRGLIAEASYSFGLALLSIHFNVIKKLESLSLKKKTGGQLNIEELQLARDYGAIGRYAHEIGAFAAMTGVAADIYPTSLIILPLFPLFFYLIIYKGYGSLYSSAKDYVIGARKKFN